MKKYFVFIVLFFLIGGISLQAQVKFGLKAGVNLANASFDKKNALDNFQVENFTGFQAGPMLEGIFGFIGFDLGVLYSQQGMKFEMDDYKLHTLQIPVNLKLKLGLIPKLLKVYGNAGPYASLKLSDKLKNQFESKSFGAGLNFGFGVELFTHLQVGANYQLGLTNDYNDFKWGGLTDLKGKPTVWSITAAYLF